MNKRIRMTRTVLIVMTIGLYLTTVNVQAAGKIDPCTLLTKAEIQTALGQNVGDGKPNTRANIAGGGPCEYTVGSYGVFSILSKETGPGETADKIMSEMKKRKITVAEAPGIGDRSFFSSPGYGMVQLNSFKGTKYLIITMLVPGATEEAQKTAARDLMNKVLKKI
jgi:hypothetical protein